MMSPEFLVACAGFIMITVIVGLARILAALGLPPGTEPLPGDTNGVPPPSC